jgi:hypothetical protein
MACGATSTRSGDRALGLIQRVAGIDHADLLTVRPNEADLSGPDPVVILDLSKPRITLQKKAPPRRHVEHARICARAV